MSIWSIGVFLLVAAICGYIANALVPGKIAGGYLVAVLYALVGACIGSFLLGQFGPSLAGISLVPAIIGSVILVAALAFFSRGNRRARVF